MKGKGGYDVMFSRSFVGGHLGKGRGQDNSEHARLLCTSTCKALTQAGIAHSCQHCLTLINPWLLS